MARSRFGFTSVDWLIAVFLCSVLLVLLGITVQRVRQEVVEGPRKVRPPVPSPEKKMRMRPQQPKQVTQSAVEREEGEATPSPARDNGRSWMTKTPFSRI